MNVIHVLQEHRRDHGIDGIASIAQHLKRSRGDDRELRAHHHLVSYRLRLRSLVEPWIEWTGR